MLHSHKTLALVFTILAGACAPMTSADEEVAADLFTPTGKADALVQNFYFGGMYQVPVDHPELEPYSAFGGYQVRIQRAGEVFQMSYAFPRLLTGISQQVQFEGRLNDDGALHFESAAGHATCNLADDQTHLVCQSELPGLTFDAAAMESAVTSISRSPSEFALRKQVGELFITDPIGTLRLYF